MSAKPSDTAVDERTQLLAPVQDDLTRRLLDDWQAECRRTAAANWLLDRNALAAPYRLGYGFGPRPADETAVIPKVAPAQPRADWDRGDDPLPCGKKIRAIGLLFGAGLASGVVLGFLAAVALFALAVS